MNLEAWSWLVDFQAAAAPREFFIFFLGYEIWSSRPLVVCVVSSAWIGCGAVLIIFFVLPTPAAQRRAKVWVIRTIGFSVR